MHARPNYDMIGWFWVVNRPGHDKSGLQPAEWKRQNNYYTKYQNIPDTADLITTTTALGGQ